MDKLLARLYQQQPAKKVSILTTAGTSLFPTLLGVSGASSTVVECIVPYARSSSIALLKDEPKQFCSPEAAKLLANTAYERAAMYSMEDASEKSLSLLDAAKSTLPQCVGLGCSAALVSSTPKKGLHRCYVAACSATGMRSYSLILEKGFRDREGEDSVAAALLLRALVEACADNATEFPADAVEEVLAGMVELSPSEELDVSFSPHKSAIEALLDPDVPAEAALYLDFTNDSDAQQAVIVRRGTTVPVPPGTLVYPGSFNPLHEGHKQLAEAAQRWLEDENHLNYRNRCNSSSSNNNVLSHNVLYEIVVDNVDKPALRAADVKARLRQFAHEPWPVLLTTTPLYVDKARLLPGCTFVVGMDTAVRIVDTKYYGGSSDSLVAALAELKSLRCQFLVAGRLMEGLEGRGREEFATFDKGIVPEPFRDMFHSLSEEQFRVDLSSSQLRAQQQRQQQQQSKSSKL